MIRGQRSSRPVGSDISCEQYHRVERGHGYFSRAFTLPKAIDVDAITAELRDGILTVTLPKVNDRSGRRVNVT
jgi:HSP20 family protein